ncbi:SAM-dependent methyltransferase [Merismopedia glauca]|uniref:SAM-dependent methyltransferase n=1 Tax=Merismopedia glauca CCAP 1448/3 TaxID=1296344 RepID=A0A2T1C1H8_9CYAN|nr:SAM-dependent methyltransferase [Merismopedia glauca]PSB02130.1 SAM-dependent methyltransferase [Merismopedia glauca CCAP 1448/3]
MTQVSNVKVEYGDFQTPLELTERICQKLVELGISPNVIIEPTCGIGNFIKASATLFKQTEKIIGLEINPNYLEEIGKDDLLSKDKRIQTRQEDFFDFDWLSLTEEINKTILVLGNFPWVTNSYQGAIGGRNLPQKENFQHHRGLDAITGKSNFDISEWMTIQTIQSLHNRDACLAMLCKTSVSRKILNHIQSHKLNLAYCAIYRIDAKKYFGVAVDACLLFCKFDSNSKNYFCDVFNSLEEIKFYRIGYQNNILIRDLKSFDRLSDLYEPKSGAKWRSGIKHDCSSVMEFRKIDNAFVNGLGEIVDLEETYLFPLVKGSDVAQNRTEIIRRYVLVTQRSIGESTELIGDVAPKTWRYLETHAEYLDARKSKIYQGNPRFSIFGVGTYTFSPWKVAICGLYKKLDFRLLEKFEAKPIIFDDTVYFLSFDDEKSAYQAFKLLTSPLAIEFYSSLIFWDEKRPIKTSILNSLNLSVLSERLSSSS